LAHVMMTKENLIVVTVVGLFVLLIVGGFAGLIVSGQQAQATYQAEQERVAAERREQEERERLATEQREQERQRQREHQERQRLAAEQREREEQERREEEERQRQEQIRQAERRASEFNLYGRTLNNENFDWNSLRGKYVLVKFTATWCPPCQRAIPGMLELYEKYRDKEFEIVSVFIRQDERDPVATVRNFVRERGLPWIILSEALTARAGQPLQRETFGIQGVPTFFLLDKEGEILVDRTHSLSSITTRVGRIVW